MIVEIDIIINEMSRFGECLDLSPVNAFCFQNGEKPRLDIDGVMWYALVRLKYGCEVY